MSNDNSFRAAQTYVRRIKNALKRDYAQAYLNFLRGDASEPFVPTKLSVMAAQAVRMHLNVILG